MKKLFLLAAATLLTTTLTFTANAQFEGKITYKITYSDLPPEMEGMEGMLPQNASVSVKGKKYRLDQEMGMMGKQTVISDGDKDTQDLLIDMMGTKVHIPMDPETVKANREEKVTPEYIYTKKKQKIAGYKCFLAKAVFTSPEGVKDTTEVWYTTKIAQAESNEFKGLKGMPLKYTSVNQGMMVTMTAEEVTKGGIEEDAFTVPEGFTKMTMEEFMEMMGGMGG